MKLNRKLLAILGSRTAAIVNVENFMAATTQIAQTTLRSVLGQHVQDAAPVIEDHPTALQLRFLQTLLELGASQSTTIIFPPRST